MDMAVQHSLENSLDSILVTIRREDAVLAQGNNVYQAYAASLVRDS